MLNVLHVIGPMRTGGAQTQLLGLVRAAHGRYWNATVVGTDGGELSDAFRALDAPYIELRRRGSPGIGRMIAFRRLVSSMDVDVIHGNLWQSNVYARLGALGRRRRPAVVISERNVEAERSAARRWLDARLAGVTDAYVGNTDAVCDFIRDVHPVGDRPVLTIANAVDRDVFAHAARSPSGELRIGAVGRLYPEKGFDVLVEACRLLLERGRSPSVTIVGEGPQRDELERRAAGLPVSLPGRLPPGPSVAEFLAGLDVFCLPSTFREGRPNVVLEAIAAGRPVVTTRIEGMDEIFHGDTLVPPGDADALATAIEAAADAPQQWIARSEAVEIATFDDLARRYLDVFEAARTP